jgi:CDGSH-type Zn-finger protein
LTAGVSASIPFVTPSGGRMDEIIRAVRGCPSGALSYAIDGKEARDQVDQTGRAPVIEVFRDGPYRITDGLVLRDSAGNPEPHAAGASAEHYALCRCGHSQNKPFCSGMHYYINFTDPVPAEEPTLFEWAGGLPALLRMTEISTASTCRPTRCSRHCSRTCPGPPASGRGMAG